MTKDSLISERFFEQVTLKDMCASEAILDAKHFQECVFDHCDFTSTRFEECSFTNCTFKNCNLTLAKIPYCQLHTSMFIDCHMIGINWTEATWHKSTGRRKSSFPLSFRGCNLDYSVFLGMNLTGAKFIDCTLKEAAFESADMSGVDLSGSDLNNAIFADTNLTQADLSRARNYTINACNNNLKRAKFSFPEATALVYALDIVVE